MNAAHFTAAMFRDGRWWYGWVSEVPGVNCQEQSKKKRIESMRSVPAQALEFCSIDGQLSILTQATPVRVGTDVALRT